MKVVFISPMCDTLKAAAVELRGDGKLAESASFSVYSPPGSRILPYVPAYFQDYNEQKKPFKNFLRTDVMKGLFRHPDFWLALHDDATDLEAHALSELMISSGAKEVSMQSFIALTLSQTQ